MLLLQLPQLEQRSNSGGTTYYSILPRAVHTAKDEGANEDNDMYLNKNAGPLWGKLSASLVSP